MLIVKFLEFFIILYNLQYETLVYLYNAIKDGMGGFFLKYFFCIYVGYRMHCGNTDKSCICCFINYQFFLILLKLLSSIEFIPFFFLLYVNEQ